MPEYNEDCECCMKNHFLGLQKKLKIAEKSRVYYRKNKEEIIIRNVKNYYARKKQKNKQK
jgi:hypothetical protein